MTFGWGIVGTGMITRSMGAKMAAEPGMHLAAVGSRDRGRAEEVAASLGAVRAHGSYDELVADPDVDAVYVATGPAEHLPAVLLALEAGKAVLVEKPFAADSASAEAMIDASRSAGAFLMEAMWMRFDPLVRRLSDLVTAGELGDIRSVDASFGRIIPKTPTERLWDPDRAGGCILDLGIYPVSFAQLILGAPDRLSVMGSVSETGIDREASVLALYSGGARALLDTSLVSCPPCTATVTGTRLTAVLSSPFFVAPTLTVSAGFGSTETVYQRGFEPDGFVGQLREVVRCVGDGRLESDVMPLQASLECIQVLEWIKRELSVGAAAPGAQ